jgi:hypothetical protein
METRFGRLAGTVVAPASRHAGGQGGGHRGCCFPARGGSGQGETGRRAAIMADEGGGNLWGLTADRENGARRGCSGGGGGSVRRGGGRAPRPGAVPPF